MSVCGQSHDDEGARSGRKKKLGMTYRLARETLIYDLGIRTNV